MRPTLTEQELQRLEAAVRKAERGTAAEIVVVVAGEPAGGAAWAPWSGLIALALSLPLVVAQPGLSAPLLYSLQLAVVLIVLLATLVPRLRCRLVPTRERARAAQRLARDQFFDLGLHRTSGRTGVLLFVSPHDRYVEVIADAGVPGPLPDAAWQPCVDAVRAEARERRLAAGLERALELLGSVLRERLPGVAPDRNELPDRPVVL
jgi:putative membrane protein